MKARSLTEISPADLPTELAVGFTRIRVGVDTDLAPHEAAIREGLAALRAGLGGAAHLLGTFTYADIVMTNLLQAVTPVADEFMKIGPATRRVWTHPALAREFADLVQWRDDIYRHHRRPT